MATPAVKRSIDQRVSEGHNKVSVALDLGGDAIEIVFREGGELKDPRTLRATAGNGLSGDGLYDEWTLEGTVSMDNTIHDYLVKVFEENNFSYKTSCNVSVYTVTNNTTWTLFFDNARIVRLPLYSPSQVGADTLMNIALSLNDFSHQQIVKGNTDSGRTQ